MPRMGSFRRVFLGYRRPDVDEAIAARDMGIRAPQDAKRTTEREIAS